MFSAKAMCVCILLVLPAAGCYSKTLEDDECRAMREIGLSGEKTANIRDWIESTLADPSGLGKATRPKGPILVRDHDVGLDWGSLGIPEDQALVEFYGPGVDYRELKRSKVEAVIIGYGSGYKLVFRLQQGTDIESKLIEASKKPYGEIRVEELGPGIVLVCQVNRFG